MTRASLTAIAACLALAACGDDPVTVDGTPGLIGDPVSGDDTGDGSDTGRDGISLDVGLGGIDTAAPDASASDAGGSSSDTAAPDADDPGDGGVPDAGGSDAGADVSPVLCVPRSQLCDGNTLVTCSDDGTAVGRIRCGARGGTCVETGPNEAECDYGDAACEPGDTVCTDDLSGSRVCRADGDGFGEPEPCPTGCNPGSGRCNPAPVVCPDPNVVDLAPGNYTFDLCEGTRDYRATGGDGDCRELDLLGPERVFRITLTESTDVLIDLRDDDDTLAIDTQLYLRTRCDGPGTQIACSDDIDCDASDVEIGDCDGGVQRRQSRISARLDAGEYYLFADSLVYSDDTSFSCGEVLLRYAAE